MYLAAIIDNILRTLIEIRLLKIMVYFANARISSIAYQVTHAGSKKLKEFKRATCSRMYASFLSLRKKAKVNVDEETSTTNPVVKFGGRIQNKDHFAIADICLARNER